MITHANGAKAGPQVPADLCIGVSNNELGVHITVMQKHVDGSATLIYSAKAPAGDSFGLASLAPQPQQED